jgi:hypothetical protein
MSEEQSTIKAAAATQVDQLGQAPPSPIVKITDITPRFKLVFTTVLAITILCLVLNLLVVLMAPNGSQAASLADTCSTAFKLGFGAIVGLVGGKVT